MKSARYIFLAAACLAVILFLVFVKKPRTVETSPVAEEAESRKASPALASASTPAPKPVEVYFLSEADAEKGVNEAPKGMRRPTINGTRKVVNARPLTSKAEGHFIGPKWSPDGLEVVFSRGGFNGLYTKGILGGNLTQITDRENVGFKAKFNKNGEIETKNPNGEKQSFKPDGTPSDSVAIEQDDSIVGTYTKDDNVYLRANPGEPAKPITDGNDRYYGGVISPDGKYVVYNGLHTGLYVQPIDGSAPPVSLGEGYSPAWLPDGSGILYNISDDDGHFLIASDLYLSTPDGQTVSNLTDTPAEIETDPVISPDGTRVAYEQSGTIYVAELE